MDEGSERQTRKGEGRGGWPRQEGGTGEQLALEAKSKSDNRMTKLSADGMMSRWVCSFFSHVLSAEQRQRFPKEKYYRGHLASTGLATHTCTHTRTHA